MYKISDEFDYGIINCRLESVSKDLCRYLLPSCFKKVPFEVYSQHKLLTAWHSPQTMVLTGLTAHWTIRWGSFSNSASIKAIIRGAEDDSMRHTKICRYPAPFNKASSRIFIVRVASWFPNMCQITDISPRNANVSSNTQISHQKVQNDDICHTAADAVTFSFLTVPCFALLSPYHKMQGH